MTSETFVPASPEDRRRAPVPGVPLRFGVLGTGYWASWCHGTVLATHPDVDFVGFWGRDITKARDAAARTGGRGFDDIDDMLNAVDAVSIALPPDVQAPLAARAARAGKHLLLDKPLALDVAAADDVVTAANESHVASLTFMTYLFQPEVRSWLSRMLEVAAEDGPWEGAVTNCAGSIDLPGSPYAQSVWRRQRGGLWDWGPHALSVVLSLLPPIAGVSATRGMRDTVNVALEHEGGPGSALTLTVTAPESAQDSSVVVWGPAGRHALSLPTGTLREAYHRAVDELLRSVQSGDPHPLGAAYSRGIVAILDAAERHLTRPLADRVSLPCAPADNSPALPHL
jgi:predicted dehydrogenase